MSISCMAGNAITVELLAIAVAFTFAPTLKCYLHERGSGT